MKLEVQIISPTKIEISNAFSKFGPMGNLKHALEEPITT
jgi:hypothetical protein